jgi:hypothetical protein
VGCESTELTTATAMAIRVRNNRGIVETTIIMRFGLFQNCYGL